MLEDGGEMKNELKVEFRKHYIRLGVMGTNLKL